MADKQKLDLYKQHRHEYVASKKAPSLVEVSPASYLAIAGRGEPGCDEFVACVGALYSVAYTIKMTRKFAGLGDYKVCSLEGQWWAEGQGEFFDQPREQWCWNLLIRTPHFIEARDLDKAKQDLAAKNKPREFNDVRLETLEEGLCVQILHAGPYSDEPRAIAAMRRFAKQKGLRFEGLHHEIYLSDPRRVPPERLRTILRNPLRKTRARS